MRRLFCLIGSIFLLAGPGVPLHADDATELAVGDTVDEVGTFIDLPRGGKLQLLIKDNQIVGHFVDDENKLVEVPAESIFFEVRDSGHRQDKWKSVLRQEGPVTVKAPRYFHGAKTFAAKVIVRYPDGDPDSFGRIMVHLDKNL